MYVVCASRVILYPACPPDIPALSRVPPSAVHDSRREYPVITEYPPFAVIISAYFTANRLLLIVVLYSTLILYMKRKPKGREPQKKGVGLTICCTGQFISVQSDG